MSQKYPADLQRKTVTYSESRFPKTIDRFLIKLVQATLLKACIG